MSILDLHADELASAARNNLYTPPRPVPASKWNAWRATTAPTRGITAGVAESAGFWSDVVGAFGQVMAATDARTSMFGSEIKSDARDKLVSQGVDYSSEAGDIFRNVARSYRPDPETAHMAETLLFEIPRFAVKAVGYSLAGGPVVGAGLTGADEALQASDELRQQGVDLATRTKVGAVQGGGAALGVALPVAGKTAAQTVGLVAAGGPATFIAQQAITREILKAADYSKIADQYDPFDPVGLAVSTLIPAGFGAYALRRAAKAPKKAPPQTEVDAALVAHQQEVRDAHSLADPADLGGMAKHEDALAKAEEQMAAGERVSVAEEVGTRVQIEPLEQFTARVEAEPNALPAPVRSDFVKTLLDLGGIDWQAKLDITGEPGIRANPGGVFRKGGNTTDVLADAMIERGFLRPGDGSAEFVELVQQHLRGEQVLNFKQQMEAAGRADAQREIEARIERAEAKLKALGVDPAPARGNVAALEGYLQQYESALLRSALDDADRGESLSPEFEALQAQAREIAQDIQDGGRTIQEYEAEVAPLSPVMRNLVGHEIAAAKLPALLDRIGKAVRAAEKEAKAQGLVSPKPTKAEVTPAPEATGAKPAPKPPAKPGEVAKPDGDQPAPMPEEVKAQGARLAEIEQELPDLAVMMDGMDEPMKLSDFLASVKKEADQMREDAPDFETAANCYLTRGA